MKQKYNKPITEKNRLQALSSLLTGTNTVPVDPGQQGDQSGADARRGSITITSVWDD